MLATITDRRVAAVGSQQWQSAIYFRCEPVQVSDYEPFGSELTNRTWTRTGNPTEYRFGFNGKETSDEIAAEHYDFGARIYSGPLGRWLSVDPLAGKYPNMSPYVGIGNNPLMFVDPDGRTIVPSDAFTASRYGAVYNNLYDNSKIYRKMTKVFTDKETRDKFNYVLDYQNYIDINERRVGQALGKTRNIGGLEFDEKDNPIGGELTTFFIPLNETRTFGDVSKQLNDVGRALVVLHEAIHADIDAREMRSLGLNANHHDGYTEVMYYGVVDALKQFNSANKFRLTDEQIGLIAWNGLQGSPLFNETFGLDPNSADYQTKLNGINDQFDSVIYNNPSDEKEKNRYNLKN